MEEIYKDIVGYEGFYKISNLGNVKSLERFVTDKNGVKYLRKERMLKITKHQNYKMFGLHNILNGMPITGYVHREIARSFIPNPNNLPCVNHLDGNKTNNAIENLEWCTFMRNIRHAYELGLMNKSKGSKHYSSKLKESDICTIKELLRDNTFQYVADKYGVSKQAIWNIHNNKVWKHVS